MSEQPPTDEQKLITENLVPVLQHLLLRSVEQGTPVVGLTLYMSNPDGTEQVPVGICIGFGSQHGGAVAQASEALMSAAGQVGILDDDDDEEEDEDEDDTRGMAP